MIRELSDAIEIVADRVYWVTLHEQPKNTSKSYYFSIDNELVYEPFFADFGPLNLACTARFCRLLANMLTDPVLADKRIIHYTSHNQKKRANAAYLMCAFLVVCLKKPSEAAWKLFATVKSPFVPFRDATSGVCTYQCTILDCVQGLEFAIRLGWFDANKFDIETYEHFEKVEQGDMNWVVPNKFLAFAGPSATPLDPDGYPAFMPEDYVSVFREGGVSLVIRLNKKQYDRRRFIDNGIKHVDLYFLDGSCPSREIIHKFLHISENESGKIAVHCKAGLGRTGTLIGLFAMKHFQFPARAFIGWNRICRPGSFLGPQQQFLSDMQAEMFQAGCEIRKSLTLPGLRRGNTDERKKLEEFEDLGQGDRLCAAKRTSGSLSVFGSPVNQTKLLPRGSIFKLGSNVHSKKYLLRNVFGQYSEADPGDSDSNANNQSPVHRSCLQDGLAIEEQLQCADPS